MKTKKQLCIVFLLFPTIFLSCQSDCLSPPPDISDLVTFLIKPNNTAKTIVLYSKDDIDYEDRNFDLAENDAVSKVTRDRNKLYIDIKKQLLKTEALRIRSSLLDLYSEYSLNIEVYEGSKLFLKKYITITTGKEDIPSCAWDQEFTTIEEVKVNDMTYVTNIAEKGMLFTSNVVLEMTF